MAISLDKIEREAPELLSLVKTSKINLDKHQLTDHTARVALVLDISGSMEELYRSGKVDELVKRALPLGLQFDDDGQIDVFAFGSKAFDAGEYGLSNYKSCVKTIVKDYGLNHATYYEKALSMIEKKYKGTKLPVYVMFVTDGDTDEKAKVERVIRSLSKQPIFIQFIGLGTSIEPDQKGGQASSGKKPGFLSRLFGAGSSSSSSGSRSFGGGFDFLSSLDDMDGREVDNVNFFAIKHPTSVSDERLYELLMNEYPQWLKAARAKGILR